MWVRLLITKILKLSGRASFPVRVGLPQLTLSLKVPTPFVFVYVMRNIIRAGSLCNKKSLQNSSIILATKFTYEIRGGR